MEGETKVTCDGQEFTLKPEEVKFSALISNARTDFASSGDPIPLPSVSPETFKHILQFLRNNCTDKALDEILGNVPLKDLLLASQFLVIDKLTDAITTRIALELEKC